MPATLHMINGERLPITDDRETLIRRISQATSETDARALWLRVEVANFQAGELENSIPAMVRLEHIVSIHD